MITSHPKNIATKLDLNIYIVKMGQTKRDFLKLRKNWNDEGVASFYIPSGLVNERMQKFTQYLSFFLNACPAKDWLIGYHKGYLAGIGMVSKNYHVTNWQNSERQHAIGVKWAWLFEPVRLYDFSKALHKEACRKSPIKLVTNPVAKLDFIKLIDKFVPESLFQEEEVDESDNIDGHIELPEEETPYEEEVIPYSLEQVAAESFVPLELLHEIEYSLTESKKYQVIFDGIPGTGKTFLAQKLAHYFTHKVDRNLGEYKLISCHSAMTYDYLFQGLIPTHSGGLKAEKGLIAKFAERAKRDPNAYFVLILDEINRANIPQVFGQFLYLLEYREHEIELPFNNEIFALPKNLLIIATMNSDDRSTGVLDFAFRRRFTTFKFSADAEILKKWLTERYSQNPDLDLDKIVATFLQLNRKILQFDHNFQVGHSYFMTEYPLTGDNIKRLWRNHIIPLLEERFFHNKIIVSDQFHIENFI